MLCLQLLAMALSLLFMAAIGCLCERIDHYKYRISVRRLIAIVVVVTVSFVLGVEDEPTAAMYIGTARLHGVVHRLQFMSVGKLLKYYIDPYME